MTETRVVQFYTVAHTFTCPSGRVVYKYRSRAGVSRNGVTENTKRRWVTEDRAVAEQVARERTAATGDEYRVVKCKPVTIPVKKALFDA